MADVRERERAGLQHEPSEPTGMAPCGVQRGHGAEARAHQAARRRARVQRERMPQPFRQLDGDEARVRIVASVLLEAVRRLRQRRDQRRNLEPVDQVVEHRLQVCVAQVVVAVVDDQQRIAPVAAEAGRHIDGDVAIVAERRARHRDLVDDARARRRVRDRPLRPHVAHALRDGIGAERIGRLHRVERIEDPLLLAVPHDLELVLDARVFRQLDPEHPQVPVANPLERLARRQAVDPAAQVHLVRGAVVDERHAAGIDDRRTPRGCDGGRVERGSAG